MMTTWQQAAWDESIRRQTISLNPDAALQKAIFAAGFVPVESEFEMTGRVLQAAEHLQTGERRLYYAVIPNWSDVRWFGEPAGYVLTPDLSKHQGAVDVPKLQAQLRANGETDFRAMLRGAIGLAGSDLRLDEYYREFRLNGFALGKYGVLKPDYGGGEQARHFATIYRRYEWQHRPAGDCELPLISDYPNIPPGQRNQSGRVLDYLEGIESELGITPAIYTSKEWLRLYVPDHSQLTRFPLWLAVHYNPPATIHPPERFWPGDLPAGWTGDFPSGGWQFSATMPGREWGVRSAGLDMSWMVQ